MENFTVGVVASLVATIIVAIFGWVKGWWLKPKKESSLELATRVFQVLDIEARSKTDELISASQRLGDQLTAHYTYGAPFSEQLQADALRLIVDLRSMVKPLVSALAASDKELDRSKRAVVDFDKSLERRAQIINHLCTPPNPRKMDAGHVRDQLLSDNALPAKALNAALGETAIFLKGYGINWFERRKRYRIILKEQRGQFRENVEMRFRSSLQKIALNKAKN